MRALAKWPEVRSGSAAGLHARAGDHAGSHRRAGGGRPRGTAGRGRASRRRPRSGRSARARRSGDRPFGAGRRLRLGRRLRANIEREYERNFERYALLRWAQGAFGNFQVVPPGMGIVHQVNLEYLAAVVQVRDGVALPDTLVGTDSHTTMVNALGVLGWGVGGIEAEAVMLGQPLDMTAPVVLGIKLDGALRPGVTATDLVLTLTELLRARGVVGSFVEFYGAGVGASDARRPRHDLQHVARVRRDLVDLPGRRRDTALPARHRPAGRAGRAGRALHQGAGPVPHRRRARSGVLRHAHLRPRLGRAEPRRAAPAAGPGVARGRARQLRGRVRREPRTATSSATARSRSLRSPRAPTRRIRP